MEERNVGEGDRLFLAAEREKKRKEKQRKEKKGYVGTENKRETDKETRGETLTCLKNNSLAPSVDD